MSQRFTIVIFTASNQEYADKILDKLDPDNRYISLRLYRHHCVEHDELYIKDLRLFNNIEMNDLIIVDNIICSFAMDLKNGVPIKPYSSSKEDYELEYLAN